MSTGALRAANAAKLRALGAFPVERHDLTAKVLRSVSEVGRMRWKILATASALALSLGACSPAAEKDAANVPAAAFDAATTEQLSSNPLLAAWTGANGGQPAFDKMDLALIAPALD